MTYRDRLLTCPRCGKPLERRTRHEAWPCRSCHGVAVEVPELVRLIRRVVPDAAGHALDTARRVSAVPSIACAACGGPMQPVQFHGVALDRCYRDDLVWFDAAQLDQVIDLAIADHEARKGLMQKLRDLLFAN